MKMFVSSFCNQDTKENFQNDTITEVSLLSDVLRLWLQSYIKIFNLQTK